MNISLDRTKEQELALLAAIEADAFNTQAKCFENGILPHFSEEEKEKNELTTLFREKDITMLSVRAENSIVGCAVVKATNSVSGEILLFFISPEYQGNGVGRTALQMVEDTFPDTKVWRLVTPTQVLRNSVFYVNKCGYKIIRIEEFDKKMQKSASQPHLHAVWAPPCRSFSPTFTL